MDITPSEVETAPLSSSNLEIHLSDDIIDVNINVQGLHVYNMIDEFEDVLSEA